MQAMFGPPRGETLKFCRGMPTCGSTAGATDAAVTALVRRVKHGAVSKSVSCRRRRAQLRDQ